MVSDLGSTNGTYLNDQAVMGEQEAQNGDRLKIGPLLFDVCIETAPSVTRPSPLPPTKSSNRNINVEDTAASLLLGGEAALPTRLASADTVPESEVIPVSAPLVQNKPTASRSDHLRPDTAIVANTILQKYLRRPRR
jgi:pSer/pThr/pTyr-binding forkhead associated (FHA) protein